MRLLLDGDFRLEQVVVVVVAVATSLYRRLVWRRSSSGNVIQLFCFVTDEEAEQTTVFVPYKPFQPSIVLVERLDLTWVDQLLGWTLSLANIRRGWKSLQETNTRLANLASTSVTKKKFYNTATWMTDPDSAAGARWSPRYADARCWTAPGKLCRKRRRFDKGREHETSRRGPRRSGVVLATLYFLRHLRMERGR